jgi:hypothetical protein
VGSRSSDSGHLGSPIFRSPIDHEASIHRSLREVNVWIVAWTPSTGLGLLRELSRFALCVIECFGNEAQDLRGAFIHSSSVVRRLRPAPLLTAIAIVGVTARSVQNRTLEH